MTPCAQSFEGSRSLLARARPLPSARARSARAVALARRRAGRFPLALCTEVVRSLKLGNVWVFEQLIHKPTRTVNQQYKNKIAKLETFHFL